MPLKNLRLVARDLSFYVSGRADVRPVPRDADPWLYPADWTYQLDHQGDYFTPLDDDGIPRKDFRKIGTHYLPSRVAAWAFCHWHRLRTLQGSGGAAHQAQFLQAATWFVRNADEEGRYLHHFSVAGIPAPWISCIAQGEAASTLVRAAVLTHQDHPFRSAAVAALDWLDVSVDEGGLRSVLPDGGVFVEEYPGSQYRHVLNGCLYAMVGLQDVIEIGWGEPRHHHLLDGLVDSVARNLPAWDRGGWSVYDFGMDPVTSHPNFNTMTYQILQVALLDHLGSRTGRAELSEWATRWREPTLDLRSRLAALLGKIRYRVSKGW